MNFKPDLKEATPYIAAIVLFLTLAFMYCSPVFQGKNVTQHDVLTARGMQKEMVDYHKATGDYTLWTNSMFGGMPTYQIGGAGVPTNNVFSSIYKAIRINLPAYSVDIIFFYLLGFFILLIVLGVNPWLSIVGAIAFAFSSYNIIIIAAGHVNKALAIGFMPMVIGGIMLIFKQKYLWGILLTVLSFGIHLRLNHVQMTYYMFIGLLVYGIVELIFAIKQKQLKTFIISSAIVVGSIGVAIVPNVANLMATKEYATDTQRGISELEKNSDIKPSNGLDKEYALRWSYGKAETFTLLIPNFYGGASVSELSTKSNLYQKLIKNGVDKRQAKEYIKQVPTYWGDQPGTSGPVYFGAIICFLFVLGFMLVDKKTKIWITVAFALTVMLGWGRNFMFLTDLFFDYFPMYNKFRAVSSIMVTSSIVIVLLAFLGLKELISDKFTKKELTDKLKKALYIVGGLTAFFLIIGAAFMSFEAPEGSHAHSMQKNLPQWFIDALIDDRKRIFRLDALRSLVFILLAAGSIYWYISKKLKLNQFVLILGILVLVDLWSVDKRYLNNDNFADKKENEGFKPTQANLQILNDPDPNFRVFNVTVDPFNESSTSYFHKSIGGYHAAKLMRYQELINYHIGQNNMQVLNMLNTKYFIVPGSDKQPMAQRNPNALGNAWFVSDIKVVADASEEINALKDFDPSKTAVLDKRFVKDLPNLGTLLVDSITASSIKLVDYKPNQLTYKAFAEKDMLAVFSEIYYNQGKGWNAYLNGKEVSHVRVNYVLRSMVIPKGEHEIVYKFEPATFYKGLKLATVGSILVIVTIISCISLLIYRRLKPTMS